MEIMLTIGDWRNNISAINEADLLKMLAIPFRAAACDRIPLNDYIFTLAFDHAFCPPSDAQRLVTLGIQRKYIGLVDGFIQLLFTEKELPIPLGWKPAPFNLATIEKMPLTPLAPSVEYHPIPVQMRFPQVPLIAVHFLKKVPQFLAVNGKTYGPFSPDNVAEIPNDSADIFIRRGSAALVTPEPSPVASDVQPPKKAVKPQEEKRGKDGKGSKTLDMFFGKT